MSRPVEEETSVEKEQTCGLGLWRRSCRGEKVFQRRRSHAEEKDACRGGGGLRRKFVEQDA